MFSEDTSNKLEHAIGNLKIGLLLSLAINVVLIVLVSTLFDGTEGFCDASSSSARESFRFVFLFQILVNTPTFVSYHLADKYAETDAVDDGVRASFYTFAAAFFLKIYMTTRTFLNGPFDDQMFVMLVGMFVLLSFSAYVVIERYSRRHIISV